MSAPGAGMLSIVVPVYKNEASLDRLLQALGEVANACPLPVEAVFVVDGSPDRSAEVLRARLPGAAFSSRLVSLSGTSDRSTPFGRGFDCVWVLVVLAADLQEPPELALRFLEILRRGEADIAFGVRTKRCDPWADEIASRLFWMVYRRFVLPELPAGGVDVFGCTRAVRDRLGTLRESNANLIALLFWLGFRRARAVRAAATTRGSQRLDARQEDSLLRRQSVQFHRPANPTAADGGRRGDSHRRHLRDRARLCSIDGSDPGTRIHRDRRGDHVLWFDHEPGTGIVGEHAGGSSKTRERPHT